MVVFINSKDTLLKNNNLTEFSNIWNLELPLVDAGNYGRGGYSLVSCKDFNLPQGGVAKVYIKRQQNYTCFSWHSPLRGIPTLQREFTNWEHCQRLGIATYDVLYFATRWDNGKQQAILITRALPALPLNDWLLQKNISPTQRFTVTKNIAASLRKLHAAKFAHGHLVPAHIFIDDFLNVYFIDLEKMHRFYLGQRSVRRDLAKLSRHLPEECSLRDRMRFLKAYLNVGKLTRNVIPLRSQHFFY